MLTVRIGQLTVGDFHPIRLTALSAVPIAHSDGTAQNPEQQISRKFQSPKFETDSLGHLKLKFGVSLACLREVSPWQDEGRDLEFVI
jgi:hypothetical protein